MNFHEIQFVNRELSITNTSGRYKNLPFCFIYPGFSASSNVVNLKIAFWKVFPNQFMQKSLFFKAINSIQIPFAEIALILQLMWRIIIVCYGDR